MPEWKVQAMGKAVTYGIKDGRSLVEQRESLPIFKLKQQLIQAVQDKQVCVYVCVGLIQAVRDKKGCVYVWGAYTGHAGQPG